MTALARLFRNHGGEVIRETGGQVCNKDAQLTITSNSNEIERINHQMVSETDPGKRAELNQKRETLAAEIAKIRALQNGPVEADHTISVNACYDGNFYFVVLPEDLRTPLMFRKQSTQNPCPKAPFLAGRSYYAENYVTRSATDEEINKDADELFKVLIASPLSPTHFCGSCPDRFGCLLTGYIQKGN